MGSANLMGGVADKIGGGFDEVMDYLDQPNDEINDLIAKVGDLFGIRSRDELMIDVQISNLLTTCNPKGSGTEPDVGNGTTKDLNRCADKQARKTAIKKSNGNAKRYGAIYNAFKNDYRRKYSANFLKSVGYNPSSTAITQALDDAAVLAYVKTKDPATVNVQLSALKLITAEEFSYDWMEDNIGWNNRLAQADYQGNTLVTPRVTVVEPDIVMKLVKEAQESITENLVANYQYDSATNTLTIGGELYNTPLEPFDPLAINGEYTVTVTHSVDLTTVDLLIPVTTFTFTQPTSSIADSKLFVRYDRGTADWFYYIENESTAPILSVDTPVDITAILTLKENDVIVGETQNMRRMMGKLNVEYSQFKESLDNNDLSAAYLMTGIHPDDQSKGGKEAIFKMFDLISSGRQNVSIVINDLSMRYSFEIEKTVVTGQIMDVGEYSNELFTADVSGTSDYSRGYEDGFVNSYDNLFTTPANYVTGVNDGYSDYYNGAPYKTSFNPPAGQEVEDFKTYTKELKFQGNAVAHEVIKVFNYTQIYTLSGKQILVTFADGPNLSRLVIPLDILNGLRYREFVDVYENSLCLLAHAREIVHFKWYQSANFSVLMKIVSFVIIIWSLGTATPIVIAANAAINVAFTFAVYAAAAYAAGYVIREALDFLVEELGLDPAIAAAITVVVAITLSAYGMMPPGQENYLTIANSVLDQVNAQQADMLAAVQEEASKFQEQSQQRTEDILEKIAGLPGEDPVVSINDMKAGSTPIGSESVETFYYVKNGNAMYNWNVLNQEAIDGEMQRRVSVSI